MNSENRDMDLKNCEFNYINAEIVIDFPIPTILQDLIEMAEKADLEEQTALYYDLAENIDTVAKNLYTDGRLTKKQWDTLCMRYW